MGNIVLLDELTINKIAAGEVIERPASVIKEMIENSIDAKANNITIEIQNGGISYIKITDNGKGIAKDDLDMAFERHATSKIRSAEDLEKVTSMGFRGEALASIAAISKVELVSKTAEQDIGYKVTVEGGQILEKEEIGCQTGTTIIVQNLFYNTPVRYKFLKKDYTETGYIEDVVTRIALVNPDISFRLINTGKTILKTSGNGDLQDVIYSIYGMDIAQGILKVDYNYEDIKISGVIGKPEIARSNRSNQLFFVNKRYVKDKILTAATEQAYKGMIDSGKFGFVVLNLEMSPTKVDVNVHPAKLEVRFQEESKIFQAVFHSIKDTMAKEMANMDTSTKVDNIIIQSSFPEPIAEINENALKEKQKTNGLFGWRKNKNDKMFGEENNIIEDLYKMKKEDDRFMPDTIVKKTEDDLRKVEPVESQVEDKFDVVNTSDVLNELKQINENVKKEIKEEEAKKDLPDGKTYTYVGENKDKIEDLLRQLHPETYAEKEESVAEEKIDYQFPLKEELIQNEDNNENINLDKTQEIKMEEEKNDNIQVTQKFDVIRESIKKLDNNINEEFDENVNKKTDDDINQNIETTEQSEIPKAFVKTMNSSPEFNQMYEKLFGTPVIKEKTEEEIKENKEMNAIDIIKDNVSVFEGIEQFEKPTYKYIGLAFDSYIIAEIDKEMYIINTNTAKEKLVYEKLKNSYYNQTNKDSQMLLLPDIIELSNTQAEIVNENLNILLQAGFNFEEFGENTIKLNGVPTVCMELDTKQLFIDILEAMNTVARTSIKEKEEKFLITIASDIVQKTNESLSIEEVNDIMDKLLSLPNPFVYGFDKPIAIKMTKYDIERKFSRK